MEVTTVFCDNYFPPTIVECHKWKDGTFTNYTEYRVPESGIYDKSVFGIWRVKYKKIDPYYYCEGQKHLLPPPLKKV